MSHPLNSNISTSSDSSPDASLSSDGVRLRKRPPKLSETRKLSSNRRDNLNNIAELLRAKWPLPSGELLSEPLLLPFSSDELDSRSPYTDQFQRCAREILDDIDTLISVTSLGGLNSMGEGGNNEILRPLSHHHYQQQVATAGNVLECVASCKVEVAFARSISTLSLELHQAQEQASLHAIMETLDQTFPRSNGERSTPQYLTSAMVELRVKARLKNFRKKVDKVQANNSILDWVNNSLQQQQQVSVISWVMAAASSSSSEEEQSQPMSAQRIRSVPRDQRRPLDQSQELEGYENMLRQSISDVTFNFSPKNSRNVNPLMRSEPSLFKHRDSDSSLPSTLTDNPSNSLDLSRASLSKPWRERSNQLTDLRLQSSSEFPDIPSPLPPDTPTMDADASVEMRTKKGRRRIGLVFDPIIERNEQTDHQHMSPDMQCEERNQDTDVPLKPIKSSEGPTRELMDIMSGPLPPVDEGDSFDQEEEAYLKTALDSHSKLLDKLPPFSIPTWLSESFIPEPPSISNYIGTDLEEKEPESFEQEWRAFQVVFESNSFSSQYRLRQNSISLNRKMQRLHEYSRVLTKSACGMNETGETVFEREQFLLNLSSLNSLLEEVATSAHTVGALTQEHKDNAYFRLCLKYVKTLQERPDKIGSLPTPLSIQNSVTSEVFLINEESLQACIEKYISQPSNDTKWPSLRINFSKFAAHQAKVNSELSLLTKQYGRILEKYGRDSQWQRFAFKLLLVIMLLLLLLIFSSESCEKSMSNILVNLRII